MKDGGRQRLLILALLLVLAGAWALQRQNQAQWERAAALDDFEARVESLLDSDDSLGAVDALNRANEADPDGALRRGLWFLQTWRGKQGSIARGVAGLATPEALVALPTKPRPSVPTPIDEVPPGVAPIALLGDRRSLVAETWALLGYASISDDPATASAVFLTDAVAAPDGAQRIIHALPDGDPLGLGDGSTSERGGCHLQSQQLPPLRQLGVRAPFDGALRTWAQLPSDIQVLAEVVCPGEAPHPAVLRRGERVVFAFDLADVLLRWRQGDRRVAGQEVDGVPGPRPSDLFPRPLTPDDLVAPFADLWMEAFARLALGDGPVVRLWHHPPGARSTLVVTSDQDFASEKTLRAMLVALADAGVWPTIFLTSGGIQPDGAPRLSEPRGAALAQAIAAGVHFGSHPVLPDWDPAADLAGTLVAQQAAVRDGYGFVPWVRRNHKVHWEGWLEPAERAVDAGFSWDTTWMTVVSRSAQSLGYMTGSGLPARFHRESGGAIELRQLASQLDDAPNPITGTSMASGLPTLERGGFLYRSQSLLRAGAVRFHGNLVLNNHASHFLRDSEWLLGLVAAARAEGAHIANLSDLRAFTEGLLMGSVRRDGDDWVVQTVLDAQDVVIAAFEGVVEVDGVPAKVREEKRFDEDVLVVTLPRGVHRLRLDGRARPLPPVAALATGAAEPTFPLAAPRFTRVRVSTSQDLAGLPAREVQATWNGWGIRGEPLDPRREDQLRVVTLGGSVTECLLLDDAEAWPARLQALLEERTGEDVWVGNMGLSGQQSIDYTARIRMQVPHLDPDLVIVMPGGNDLQGACEDRLLPIDLSQPAMLSRISEQLFSFGAETLSAMYADAALPPDAYAARLRTRSTDKTALYVDGRARRAAATELRDAIRDLDDHLGTYRANLGQLVDALDALPDSQGLLLTHPAVWGDDLSDATQSTLWAGYSCLGCAKPAFHSVMALRAGLDAFNGETLRVCEERGVRCFDIAPRIDRSIDNFYDDAHLTAEGAAVFAEALATYVIEQELLP